MSIIKGLEAGFVQLIINLNKVNAKEAARNVAEALDKALDARYGGKRSEEVQNSLLEAIELFLGAFKEELKRDQVPLAPLPEPPKAEPPKAKSNVQPKKHGK